MQTDTKAKKTLYALFAGIYILVVMFTFYSDTMIPKISSMIIIPIAFFIFMIQADFDRVKQLSGFAFWMIVGCLLVYVLSVIVWIINIEKTMYIMEGTQRLIFQLVNILVAFSAIYVFGSKGVDYTLYGAFGMNAIVLMQGLIKYGPAGSLNDIVHTFTTGEQLGFMSVMEINEVTYVYVIFILYYIFISQYSVKKKAVYIGISAFFFIMGFKRIILASAAIAALCSALFFILKPKYRKNFGLLIGIPVAVVSFLYIPFIRYGLFEYTMNLFNINTNTRIDLYNFIKDTYSFTPDFIGRGLDFVFRYLKYVKTLRLHYKGATLQFIHNDILVRYIEMGFWGFCGWLYACCIFCQRWIQKNYGLFAGAMYAVINLYSFINWSVGNTNHAYVVRLSVVIVVIGAGCLKNIELKGIERHKNGLEMVEESEEQEFKAESI